MCDCAWLSERLQCSHSERRTRNFATVMFHVFTMNDSLQFRAFLKLYYELKDADAEYLKYSMNGKTDG